jgi:hypothetical protein
MVTLKGVEVLNSNNQGVEAEEICNNNTMIQNLLKSLLKSLFKKRRNLRGTTRMRSYRTTVVAVTTKENYTAVMAAVLSVVEEARIIISLIRAGMKKKNPQINTTILNGANSMAVQEDSVAAEVVEGMGIVVPNSKLSCSNNLSSSKYSLNNTAILTKPNINEGTSNSPTGTLNHITAKHVNNKTCPAISSSMTTTNRIVNTTMSKKKICS